jgi:hypothetical protein
MLDAVWGSAERTEFSDLFQKRLELLPLSLATAVSFLPINGNTRVTVQYDLPNEADFVNSEGSERPPTEITFWRPELRTTEIEYGPLVLSDFALSNSGHRIDVPRLVTDMQNGCIRKLDRLIINSLEQPISCVNKEIIPFSDACRIPFDTLDGGNPDFAAVAHNTPTWAEVTTSQNLVSYGSAGCYLTPQKINLAVSIMEANGIPPEAPKICLLSPFQELMLKNNMDMKNYDFNNVKALTISELQPYGLVSGFIKTDMLPRAVPLGPNTYNGGRAAAGCVPAGIPAGLTGKWIEHAYIVALPYVECGEGMPWTLKEAIDARTFNQYLGMRGVFGAMRSQVAAAVSIECVTSMQKIIPLSVKAR